MKKILTVIMLVFLMCGCNTEDGKEKFVELYTTASYQVNNIHENITKERNENSAFHYTNKVEEYEEYSIDDKITELEKTIEKLDKLNMSKENEKVVEEIIKTLNEIIKQFKIVRQYQDEFEYINDGNFYKTYEKIEKLFKVLNDKSKDIE